MAIQRIREFRKETGINRHAFAVNADVAEKTVRNIDDDDWNPNLRTLRRLESIIPDDFTPKEKTKHNRRSHNGTRRASQEN